ncbi:MAG: VWA domain-containing protein [Candidatus Omnitrophica bacterium]|nr:VWA domain-containing protein [Candidatus Omnitrophota bacterium]
MLCAICCLLLALIGPQWGFHWEPVRRRGVDLMVAIDVSNSMLAEDITPNRLSRAKWAVQELLPLLRGDRLGLVAFAGSSFVQCPLTNDYGAVALTLEDLSTGTIPKGGTALASAIRASVKAFDAGTEESRALIIITDGEDHEGDALAAANDAANTGVKIFCIGMGTPEGELIPAGPAQPGAGFMKDREGRTVKSRLNEELLQRVALATGGSYVRATPTAFGLDVIYRERIANMKTHEVEGARQKQYEPRFQWPLALAWLLLIMEALIADRRRGRA